jgi:hypothetical protein
MLSQVCICASGICSPITSAYRHQSVSGTVVHLVVVWCLIVLHVIVRHGVFASDLWVFELPLSIVTGEESRWTAQSKEFDAQIQRLTGDCAVASAFASYLGPFNKEFRELLMARDFYGDCLKLNIPVTQNIEVRRHWVVHLCATYVL